MLAHDAADIPSPSTGLSVRTTVSIVASRGFALFLTDATSK
jgi:hypothetical protein